MKQLFDNADFNASFIESLLIALSIITTMGNMKLTTTIFLLIVLIIKLLYKNDTERHYKHSNN